MKAPKPVFCEWCGKMKPWSTIYRGLASRGKPIAVCPECKKFLEENDK